MDVATARPTESDRYVALARTTGIIGITFLVLLFGPIIALSSAGEPPLVATATEALQYFVNLEATWAQLVSAASTLGMISCLWFFVAFGFLLGRAEGNPAWRSTIATLSGALLGTYGLVNASWQAASQHGGRITAEVADFAYALGNVGFANAWIALASFALCSGWVILSTGMFERWMGWWVVAAGVGLVVARFVWAIWGVGYALLWIWILVVCIRLIRRPDRWSSPAG
jgi:hypothetical protein